MNWPDSVERVSAALRAAAVEARIEEFDEQTRTAQDAAEAVGCDVGQIVKSLVFVCDGAFVMGLVPGDRRADEAVVGNAVGAKLTRLARPAEVLEATGFEPGAVAPFPQRAVVQTLMDTSFFAHQEVWVGAGTTSHMAVLPPGELLRLTGARTVDLSPHG
jgi:prolyl-tRNA editing enzyme YbaK/EbsC (Cys-tRNA(Pro) deacylase)